jgi:hypothetical protein
MPFGALDEPTAVCDRIIGSSGSRGESYSGVPKTHRSPIVAQ